MRAAIFRQSWIAGGAETYLLDCGGCLRKEGFAVDYLSMDSEVSVEALQLLGRHKSVKSFRLLTGDARAVQNTSRNYDLFINGASHFPIAAEARRNWMVVFAPGAPSSATVRKLRRAATSVVRRAADGLSGLPGTAAARNRLRMYPPVTEGRAIRSYESLIGVSGFVAERVARCYGRRCHVIYPGVAPMACHPQKEPLVVTVGRFSPWGNVKRHDAMIDAARHLAVARPDVRVVLVGSLPSDDASHRYLTNLQAKATGFSSVQFVVNAERRQVEDWLGRASVYWHAAGYGLDAAKNPDAVEHFGISVVEGMSAGAVPFVCPIAGPAEIVTDGVDGRHWNSPAELATLTAAVLSDPPTMSRLAVAAVHRSREFAPKRMSESIRALLTYQGNQID